MYEGSDSDDFPFQAHAPTEMRVRDDVGATSTCGRDVQRPDVTPGFTYS